MDRSITASLATPVWCVYISGTMRERDLRETLSRIGPQKPGLEYAGELVDGRRRAEICAELGMDFPIRSCSSLSEVCSLLWLEHPARALELARAHDVSTVLELAALCSTTAVGIAKEMAASKPRKSHARVRAIEGQPYRRLKRSSKMVRRLFVLEPELLAYAKEAAAQKGHGNVSKIVRDALWKEVALTVPNAPQFQPRRVQSANGAREPRRRKAG